jgi:NAD-dependent oxidoreductase involved in siderophore biosynthesis
VSRHRLRLDAKRSRDKRGQRGVVAVVRPEAMVDVQELVALSVRGAITGGKASRLRVVLVG